MARYLLRNCIRDRALDKRRAQHPGKVTLRPIIGNKPLPAAASRILQTSDLTRTMLDEIEHHQGVGNVQLLNTSKGGNEVDISALRAELGWAPAVVPVVEIPPVPVVEESVSPSPSAPEPVSAPVEESVVAPAPAVDPVVEPAVDAVAEDVLEQDQEDAVSDVPAAPYEVELREKSNEELRQILVSLGGTGSGKAKSKLVAEILERSPSGGT